jgi:membrane associated rhomboid family serine protease
MDAIRQPKRVIWTYLIGLCTTLAYVGMRYQAPGEIISDSILVKYGALYAKDIYDGAIWGVVSNSFLHSDLTYFLCNILAFLFMGRIIEKYNGTKFLLFFGLMASAVTSCTELAFTSDPGIGLTGVNFGLLSYLLISPEIKWKNPWIRATPWFVIGIVLFMCVEQIMKRDYETAVYSILGGLAFGVIVGLTKRVKWLFYSVQTILISVSILSLFYNPFSSEWNTVKGYHAHLSGKSTEAKVYYSKALLLSPNNQAARKNLKQLEIEKLIDSAYFYHTNKEYGKAQRLYFKILSLDRNNAWAKANLAELP